MVCGQSTITNDHCCKPFSGVGPTHRRRYGSAYTVVVKATKVAYGRRASVSQPAEPCRREAAPRSPCRVAAAWALLLSRHVLEGICEPRCRIGCSFGGWKSCQLTAGRIQARPIGRIADIRNPNGRRAQALRALAVTKFRGTDACCPGSGHGVIGNAPWWRSITDRAGWIASPGQGIAEAVTLCRVLSFMRLAKVLARLRKQRVCPWIVRLSLAHRPRSSGEAGRPSTSASCRTAAFGCSALIAWFQPVRSTLSAIQGTRQHRLESHSPGG
jgi:hypothetical protein